MPTPQRITDLSVLVPAAGCGDRLGRGPKALLELAGRPLIAWLSRKLLTFSDEVIIAAPPTELERVSELCPGCRCIAGGATRQQSVAALVASATRDWIVLADVARPFVSAGLYRDVLQKARETGVAGAFLTPDVPVAQLADGRLVRDFRPDEVGLFQLPHAFSSSLLKRLLEQADRNGWQEQSTLQLAIRAGLPIGVMAGEPQNIKLTNASDWAQAQLLTEYLQ